jgi:hypothetical protein
MHISDLSKKLVRPKLRKKQLLKLDCPSLNMSRLWETKPEKLQLPQIEEDQEDTMTEQYGILNYIMGKEKDWYGKPMKPNI